MPRVLRIERIERQARLVRRHRLAPGMRAGDVTEAAESTGLPARDRPRHGLPVRLGARRRHGSARPGARPLRRPVPRQAPGDAPDALRLPARDAGVAQAGASDRVADTERRRLVRDVEAAGLHRDGERWLSEACTQVLEVLADGREATSSQLRDAIPPARGVDYLRAGQGVGRPGGGGSARADRPLGRGTHRARVERRGVGHVTAALGRHAGLARRGARASPVGRGRRGAGLALAAGVRARDGR